jgi:hypothetical protein
MPGDETDPRANQAASKTGAVGRDGVDAGQRLQRLARLCEQARVGRAGDLLRRIDLREFGWCRSETEEARRVADAQTEVKRAEFGPNATSINADLFLALAKEAETAWEFVADGQEAFVYRNPVEPAVVYKFVPRVVFTDGRNGAWGIDVVFASDGTFKKELSRRPESFFEKLWLLERLGLPTEILGVTEGGTLVVQQAAVVENWSRSVVANTGGVVLHAVPDTILRAAGDTAAESRIVVIDGRFFLMADLHDENIMADSTGSLRIIDAAVAEIPAAVRKKAPRFFAAIV